MSGLFASSRCQIRIINISSNDRIMFPYSIVGRIICRWEDFEIRSKIQFVTGRVLQIRYGNPYGNCALLRASASFTKGFVFDFHRISAIRTRRDPFNLFTRDINTRRIRQGRGVVRGERKIRRHHTLGGRSRLTSRIFLFFFPRNRRITSIVRRFSFFQYRRSSSAFRRCDLSQATLSSGRTNFSVFRDYISVVRCHFTFR